MNFYMEPVYDDTEEAVSGNAVFPHGACVFRHISVGETLTGSLFLIQSILTSAYTPD